MKTNQLTFGHYVPLSHLALLVNFAEREKINFKPYLQKFGLAENAADALNAVIPAAKYTEILLALDVLVVDDSFWFRFGLTLDFPAYGVLGQAVLCCDTLGHAVKTLAEFYPILSCGSALEADHIQDNLALHILRLSPIEARESIIRTEILATTFVTALRSHLPDGGARLRFHFDYVKPSYSKLYKSFLGPHCIFADPRSKLIIPSDYLGVKMPQSNPVMFEIYSAECRQIVTALESDYSIMARVQRLILAGSDRYPTATEIASQLGLSNRSLSRHLKSAETTFQEIVVRAKTQRAVHLLKTTGFSIEEIGFRLGYNNGANFRRAFVQWTGQTPSTVRAATKPVLENNCLKETG
jgi:AraC-like DNA-binding protein